MFGCRDCLTNVRLQPRNLDTRETEIPRNVNQLSEKQQKQQAILNTNQEKILSLYNREGNGESFMDWVKKYYDVVYNDELKNHKNEVDKIYREYTGDQSIEPDFPREPPYDFDGFLKKNGIAKTIGGKNKSRRSRKGRSRKGRSRKSYS